MNQNFPFLLALGLIAVGFLILLVYAIRLMTTNGSKNKYDFISRNEVNHLLLTSIFIIGGVAIYFNVDFIGAFNEASTFTKIARIFTSVAGVVLFIMIVQAFLKYYYPFYIEKRLKVLRYKPRISPKSGKPMKLLTEQEEDAYLDEGMQAEENLYSVDYDVWKDEETGFILIEKYSGHLHALKCPECDYQTLRLVNEEIITEPTFATEGELTKHYQCTYCKHKAKKSVVLKKQHASTVPA